MLCRGLRTAQQIQKMCQILAHYDHNLRELETWSSLTWLLDQNGELAKHLMAHMDSAAKLTAGAALAKLVLDSPARHVACPRFADAHDKITSIEKSNREFSSLSRSQSRTGVSFAKSGPTGTCDAWTEVRAMLSEGDFAETIEVAAPLRPLIRLAVSQMATSNETIFNSCCTNAILPAELEEGCCPPLGA